MQSNLQYSPKFIFPQHEIERLIEFLSQVQSDQNVNLKNYDERFQEYLSKQTYQYLQGLNQTPISNQNQEVNKESYIKILNLLFPKQNEQFMLQKQQNIQQNICNQQDSYQIFLLNTLIQLSNNSKCQQNSTQQIENINAYSENIDKSFNQFDADSQQCKDYIQKLICTVILKDLEINSLKQQLQKQVIAQFSQKQEDPKNESQKTLSKINKQLDEIMNLIEMKEILQNECDCSKSHVFQNQKLFNFDIKNQEIDLQKLQQKTEAVKNKIEQFLDEMRQNKIQITQQLKSLDVDQNNQIYKIQNKKQKIDFRKSKTCMSLDSKLQAQSQQQQKYTLCQPNKNFSDQKLVKMIEKNSSETPKRNSLKQNYENPINNQNIKRKSSFFHNQKFKTFNEADNNSNCLQFIDTDFAGIKNMTSIQTLLRKKQTENTENVSYFFSDQVKKFSHSKKCEEKVICLDESSFYVLNGTDNLNGYKKFPIKDISKIIISQSNQNLCSIHIQQEFELIIETSHRELLLKYIINIFQDVLKINQPIIQNSSSHKQQKTQKQQNILKNAILNQTKQYLDQNTIQNYQQEINKSFDSISQIQQ
ncbi:hypothetical protein TTHERM_00849510 (macronuclear) [Tetrahymena thermophila SB210]|uniref:TH1 domain-containing protein n=1 Tax=Tetrahymena thermophila (strain SB210) TaxID=312017 RepID=Q23R33_TETTS|nr:hypothetical protein TTHERM_00849510 [Tetrahymena thermophila SB210]EAR99008.1 hypothetical protein TTHERM_00849510 [Tetrahymena thermophila SB210]|eukprot:XP_001019253.1 hypothetical protein TTHERM_00849510 [Tetrahymena thermophila SB210]